LDAEVLQRATPESQGVASSAVLQFVGALESQIHELHSFMVLRHGAVIAEGWWSPYGREYPHMVFSLSKSFTSTGVGLAISEGRFSLDDPVLSFFPEVMLDGANNLLNALCVRHLLTMSTGHEVDTWGYMSVRSDGDWIKGFFEVPILHRPGTHFVYNTGATYILSAIVQRTTGMKLVDYLQPRLFKPLAIENITWQESPQGITVGGVGLSLKTEDIARFGQLYLQGGLWQGHRILPPSWVNEATAFQIGNGEDKHSDWTQGYGYQFWRCRHEAYRGDGVFGQYCIVMPEQDAVIAMTGGVDLFEMQQPLDLIWELLLPAMEHEPRLDDPLSQRRLAEKLSSLAILPVQGQPTPSFALRVSGRMYELDANDLNLKAITLDFGEVNCTVRVKTPEGEETIVCGYGHWEKGQTSLFRNPWLVIPTPVTASGGWTSEDNFTIVFRLYETPFSYTFICHFVDDSLLIEARVNASLEAVTTLLLTAQLA
jgi:CubicO group peptidase (beta-lactamase class C family)